MQREQRTRRRATASHEEMEIMKHKWIKGNKLKADQRKQTESGSKATK